MPAPRTRPPLGPALFSLALLPFLFGGCMFSAHRDAPVDFQGTWKTHLQDASRGAFEGERVGTAAPEIAWRSNAGRGLDSSPILSGSVLLAATTNRMIMAMDAESGERYWEHRKQGPLTVAPVVDDRHIYVTTSDVRGQVYALRRHDGRERWKMNIPGVAVPLLLDEKNLYLASVNGRLTALEGASGKELWSTFIGPVTTAPVLDGERILLGTSRDSIYAVDRSDGSILDREALSAQISAPPAVRDGIIYLPLQNGEMVAMRSSSFEKLWQVQAGAPILASPVVSRDGTIYILDRTGTIFAVTAEGEIRELTRTNGAVTGSLSLAENALLVGQLDGNFHALSRESGEKLWSIRFQDGIHSPAIMRGGDIFIPLRRGTVVMLR